MTDSLFQIPHGTLFVRSCPMKPFERPVWNPALIEILPLLLQKGDEPAMWAAYVHELRRALPHYTEAVILPLPLHLASLAEEYALPVQWQDEKDE